MAEPANWTKLNDEVFYADGPIVRLDTGDIAFLKRHAAKTPRGCARVCAHPGADDLLHEMVIVLTKGFCVTPHRHRGKSESFHVIEGALTIVIFDDDGAIRDVIPMAPPGSDRTFYYRLPEKMYHTVIPETDVVVFHETTNGPFKREDMEFAAWAPGENDPDDERRDFVRGLVERIA